MTTDEKCPQCQWPHAPTDGQKWLATGFCWASLDDPDHEGEATIACLRRETARLRTDLDGLAGVAGEQREALEATERAANTTQAHEMGVLPYGTSAKAAAEAWERADRLREAALARPLPAAVERVRKQLEAAEAWVAAQRQWQEEDGSADAVDAINAAERALYRAIDDLPPTAGTGTEKP